MTNLLHELRSYLGGELGNRAADEIERPPTFDQVRDWLYRHDLKYVDKDFADPAYPSLTIETVSQWLETQGLTAVSKADAERLNAAAGYVLMPRALTAENGAKAALSGEFKASVESNCPACNGEGCELCNIVGLVTIKVPITWDTIKKIYAAAVAACALENKP